MVSNSHTDAPIHQNGIYQAQAGLTLGFGTGAAAGSALGGTQADSMPLVDKLPET